MKVVKSLLWFQRRVPLDVYLNVCHILYYIYVNSYIILLVFLFISKLYHTTLDSNKNVMYFISLHCLSQISFLGLKVSTCV